MLADEVKADLKSFMSVINSRKRCFNGKINPCISFMGQKAFHSGYEPREKDKLDIAAPESIAEQYRWHT